jgi:hypothetical protein
MERERGREKFGGKMVWRRNGYRMDLYQVSKLEFFYFILNIYILKGKGPFPTW